ncbi:Na+/H+ antiporter subunit E [Halorarius halobius]|uniref:Na+/H+ antiporter subunit E n=1 Tax=Halorarius halobius TaxID=2962671 RepID=UPI0020CDFB06|nr:Na+/H+ antiporter subunit E [Halorarius halobius]
MRARKWPLLGLMLAVLWLFVRGVHLDAVVGEFLIGLAVGMPVAYVLRRFYTERVHVGGSLRSIPWILRYLAVFIYELLTANVDVAYRVLHPSLPIDPDVIAVPLRVESDAAITTIANSITLTPGTLTMDHDSETNTLYVHAIVGDVDSVVAPIRTWEDYALYIFDEDASPSDPAPAARSGRERGGRRE